MLLRKKPGKMPSLRFVIPRSRVHAKQDTTIFRSDRPTKERDPFNNLLHRRHRPPERNAFPRHVTRQIHPHNRPRDPTPSLPNIPSISRRPVSPSPLHTPNIYHLNKLILTRYSCSQFIQSTYPSLKSAHPDLKIMIREASGVEPRAFVRFGESVC